jgi:YD repeat-containing protein
MKIIRNKRLKQTMAVMLSLVMLFSTLTAYPLTSAAQTFRGNPSLMDPNSVLDFLPRVNQDPMSIPNPLQGMLPSNPQIPSLTPDPSGAGVPAAPLASQGNVAQIAGSQLFNDKTEHPVDVTTGNINILHTDLSLPSVGFGFELKRSYSTPNQEVGAFGRGWQYNLDSLLRIYAEYTMGEFRQDGSTKTYTFVKDDPGAFITRYDNDDLINYELHKGHYESTSHGDTLERVSQHEYVVTKPGGTKLTYYGYFAPWREEQHTKAGKVIQQQDRYGNTMTFDYNEEGHVTQITDTSGRVIQLVWSDDLVTQVIDPMGQVFTYAYDEQQRLVQVTKPDGRTEQYQYDEKYRLTGITDGTGATTTYQYNDEDQVVAIINAEEVTALRFDYAENQTTMTNALDYRWTYTIEDKKVIREVNPLDEEMGYTYDDEDRLTQVVSPQGTVSMTYDQQDRVETETNLAGGVTSYEYDDTWNLPTKITDPSRGTTSLIYDEEGNIEKRIDANGMETTFGYDQLGQMIWAEDLRETGYNLVMIHMAI